MRRYFFSEGQSLAVTEAVYTHSILYGVSFFFTYSFPGAMTVATFFLISGSHPNINAWLYPIRFLVEMFYPLQGVFNCIIYWHAKRSGDVMNQSRRRCDSPRTRCTTMSSFQRIRPSILSGLSPHPTTGDVNSLPTRTTNSVSGLSPHPTTGDVTSLPTRTTNSGAETIPLESTEGS
jgi:hypothetical protein